MIVSDSAGVWFPRPHALCCACRKKLRKQHDHLHTHTHTYRARELVKDRERDREYDIETARSWDRQQEKTASQKERETNSKSEGWVNEISILWDSLRKVIINNSIWHRETGNTSRQLEWDRYTKERERVNSCEKWKVKHLGGPSIVYTRYTCHIVLMFFYSCPTQPL